MFVRFIKNQMCQDPFISKVKKLTKMILSKNLKKNISYTKLAFLLC